MRRLAGGWNLAILIPLGIARLAAILVHKLLILRRTLQ